MLNNQRVTPGKSPFFIVGSHCAHRKAQGAITAHTSNAQLDHTGACHTTSYHRFGLTRNAAKSAAKSWEIMIENWKLTMKNPESHQNSGVHSNLANKMGNLTEVTNKSWGLHWFHMV
jgi:hypothetical protein